MSAPALSERPRAVAIAVTLIWLSLALTVVALATSFARGARGNVMLTNIAVFVGVFVVFGFLNIQIMAGRNWARILFMVLFVLGLVEVLSQALIDPLGLDAMVLYLENALELIAVVLLFAKPARIWFRPPSIAEA